MIVCGQKGDSKHQNRPKGISVTFHVKGSKAGARENPLQFESGLKWHLRSLFFHESIKNQSTVELLFTLLIVRVYSYIWV